MFRGAEPREAKLHEVEIRQPWDKGLFRPCETRAAFAATHVAAGAVAQGSTRSDDINRFLQQSF